jgi:hypothetical protein
MLVSSSAITAAAPATITTMDASESKRRTRSGDYQPIVITTGAT